MIPTLLIILSATQYLPVMAGTGPGCDYGTSEDPVQEEVPIANFTYTGLRGPYNWATIDGGRNALCDSGTEQSPINVNLSTITTESGVSDVSISIQSYPDGAHLENIGSTLEIPSNGTLTDGSKTYNLAQFHFHTPSEHRIDERAFVGEIHFVFESEDKELAVVAVLIELGDTTPLLANVFSNVKSVETPGTSTTTGPLDFSALQDRFAGSKVYRRVGSLTTPPCTEGINWVISEASLSLDSSLYTTIQKIIGFNSRPTQDGRGGVLPSVVVSSGPASGGSA